MKKTLQIIALIALAVILLKPLQASGQFFFMENQNVGKEAQDFTLKTLNSGNVSLKDFREGKKAMVFFWATWCPHCRVALAKLNEKRAEIQSAGIKIALVDIGESEAVVGRYFERNNISMDVFLDEKSKVAESYGIIGVPTFYFVNEDGIVKDVRNSLPEDFIAVFTKK